MDDLSRNDVRTDRKPLLVEELEERIAPVIVSEDPSTWWLGRAGAENAYGEPGTNDEYWIFYIGPGEADIRGFSGGDPTIDSFAGLHLGNISITGSTMESALFILDFPDDPSVDQDLVPGVLQGGTLQCFGSITVQGNMGYIALDGIYWGVIGDDDFYVTGDLGKFDVGALVGDILVEGDIYEIAVDTTIGVSYQPPSGGMEGTWWWLDGDITTLIKANGNIGAIRVGVGLTDGGADPATRDVLGGLIYGHDWFGEGGVTGIYANWDQIGPPGTIDLIEVMSGAQNYGGSPLAVPGSLGAGVGDSLPRISAGPGGNVRFINIMGEAHFKGPGGIATAIAHVFVTPDSPAVMRTIVDDSGGVLVINPETVVFEIAEGVEIAYPGAVEYLIIPVDRLTQGPGAVIARVVANGTNTFNVSGEVEIGNFQIGTEISYSEGAALDAITLQEMFGEDVTSIDDLDPSLHFEVIKNLQEYARTTISGPGECDVYFLSGGNIPIFLNNTRDGDIANVMSGGDIIYLAASTRGGDIGATESITPYLLKGPIYWEEGDIAWVDSQTDLTATEIVPFGVEGSLTRYNGLHGVSSDGNVYVLRAGGAIGDVRVLNANIGYVQANTNNLSDAAGEETPLFESNIMALPPDIMPFRPDLDPPLVFLTYWWTTFSPFGKGQNTIGDGIFGRIMTGTGIDFPDSQGSGLGGGGYIWKVSLGEGLEATVIDYTNVYPLNSPFPNESGVFIGSGIYSSVFIHDVAVSGPDGRIYGSITGQLDNPDDNTAVNVHATDGAVIDGLTFWTNYNMWQERDERNGWITATSADMLLGAGATSGTVGIVSSTGNGASILDVNIFGYEINAVKVTGATDSGGIVGCRIYSSEGGVDLISSDGMGIIDTTIFVNGMAGKIQTTGKESIISGCDILAVSGLQTLQTFAIQDSTLDIYTLGKLSKLDYMDNTVFMAGGLRQITVKHDITDSRIVAQGPLDKLNVGGNIEDSDISAVGFFARIGTIKVKGGIVDSTIFSTGSIKQIDAGTGGIDNTDITALGTVGKAKISAAGVASGSWDFAHEITSIKTKTGSIEADITAPLIGTISSGANITGDINSAGGIRAITAIGNIGLSGSPNNISVGGNLGILQSRGAGIYSNVFVGGAIGSMKAAGDIGQAGLVVIAGGSVGTVSAGAGGMVGDINSTLTVTGGLKSLLSTGSITGDLSVGANLGTVKATGLISGDIAVTGNASSIRAGGNIGNPADGLSVGGNLGTLTAGSSRSTAQVLCDVSVGGNLGTMNVSGAFPASLSVGGSARTVFVGGDAGEIGDAFNIGASLGSLKVGNLTNISDLFADVSVGTSTTGNLATFYVRGDVYGDLAVSGSVNTINTGLIKADITINGDLRSIYTGSQLVPAIGDPPIDYYIYNGLSHDGDLIVLGTIINTPR